MSRFSRRFWVTTAVIIVVLVLLGLTVRGAGRPRRNSLLEVHVTGEIPESAPAGPFGSFLGTRTLTVLDYVAGIRRARDDRRIRGLILAIDGPRVGFAKLQELRDAVRDFQASGKWAVAFLETAGEFAPGNKDYYLATACSSIWVVPSGDVNLTGLRIEVPFIRGTLDKLGIVPDFDHLGKYKNFMNMITDTAMNAPYRESMDSIADGLSRQMIQGIAEGRKLTEPRVAALIDQGPFTGSQALQAKLIDHLGYRDQLDADLKEKNGGALPRITLGRYLKGGVYYDRGTRVALIYGVGTVGRGESGYDPVFSGSSMGATTVAGAIRQAREDRSIKAIILRIDSPGGSYIASDIIWHEVELTRGVKPIVASMSDVAGSGGYFVAMGSDRIIAEPGTLTASIGVLAGKFVTTGFWSALGITSDAVQRGKHATFYSKGMRYTPEERAIFESWLQRIYRDFVQKAAKGRGKSFEAIDAVAQGRVWLGKDAQRLGLVDELGGLPLAIRRALELAKVDPEGRVNLIEMPRPKGLLRRILDSGDDTRAALEALRLRVESLATDGPGAAPEQVLQMPIVPRID